MKVRHGYFHLMSEVGTVAVIAVLIMIFYIPALSEHWVSPQWRGPLAASSVRTIWGQSILSAGVLGLFAGGTAWSIRRSTISWILPDLRRSIRTGVCIIGMVVVAFFGLIHWGFTGQVLAATGVVATVFAATALLTSGLGGRNAQLVAFAALLFAFSPAVLVEAVNEFPLPFALLIVPSTLWLYQALNSTDMHRAQITDGAEAGELPQPWMIPFVRRFNEDDYTLKPHRNTIGGWLQTARESGYVSNTAWLMGNVWSALYYSIYCYVLAMPFLLLAYTPGHSPNPATLPFAGNLIYPASRRVRASVTMLASSIGMLIYAVGVGLAAGFLFAFKPIPQLPWFDQSLPRDMPLTLAMLWFWVWSPIMFWATFTDRGVISARPIPTSVTGFLRGFGVMIVFMLCVMGSLVAHVKVLRPVLSIMEIAFLALAAAAVTHTIHYAAVRRSFRHRDLL